MGRVMRHPHPRDRLSANSVRCSYQASATPRISNRECVSDLAQPGRVIPFGGGRGDRPGCPEKVRQQLVEFRSRWRNHQVAYPPVASRGSWRARKRSAVARSSTASRSRRYRRPTYASTRPSKSVVCGWRGRRSGPHLPSDWLCTVRHSRWVPTSRMITGGASRFATGQPRQPLHAAGRPGGVPARAAGGVGAGFGVRRGGPTFARFRPDGAPSPA